jgi:hypothetical protein
MGTSRAIRNHLIRESLIDLLLCRKNVFDILRISNPIEVLSGSMTSICEKCIARLYQSKGIGLPALVFFLSSQFYIKHLVAGIAEIYPVTFGVVDTLDAGPGPFAFHFTDT